MVGSKGVVERKAQPTLDSAQGGFSTICLKIMGPCFEVEIFEVYILESY